MAAIPNGGIPPISVYPEVESSNQNRGTPRLLKVSKDLSYKIDDPVTLGDEDGKRFSAHLRLNYIERAYGTLVSVFEMFHPNITKVLPDYYKMKHALITSGNTLQLNGEHIFEVYYTTDTTLDIQEALNKMLPASHIDPQQYLATKYGLNDYRKANDIERYWTVIDNTLYLLPENAGYSFIKYVYKNPYQNFVYNEGDDLSLANEYLDMLVLLAAMEAMSDIGDVNRYSLYMKSYSLRLEMLIKMKSLVDIKDLGKV